MKRAEEILEIKRQKLEEKRKLDQELINTEMLEVEKMLNTYENNLLDNKGYITVPLIIKTDVVKNLLQEKGYIIDRVSNDIEVNTTRIWIDKSLYKTKVNRNAISIKCNEISRLNRSTINNLEELDKARTQKSERKEVAYGDISFQESFSKFMEELKKQNRYRCYER